MKSLKPHAPAATPTAAAPRPHPLIGSILAHHAANPLPVATAQQQPRLTRSQTHHKYLLSTLAPWLSKTYSTEAAAAARGRVLVPPQGTHVRNTGRRSNDGLLAERHETDRHHKRLSRALLMDMNELLIRGGGKGASGSRTPKEWDAWWLRFVAWMAVARALHRKTLLTVLTHPFGMLSRPHGPHIPVPATLAHIIVSSFLALLSMPDLTREQTAMCRYIAAAGRDLVLLLMSLLTEEAGDVELEVMETFASALFKGLSDREKCQAPNAKVTLCSTLQLALYADLILILPATFHRPTKLTEHESPIRFLAHPLLLIRHCVVPVMRACVWSRDRSSSSGARVMRDLEQFLLAWTASMSEAQRNEFGALMSQIAQLLRLLANAIVAAPRLKSDVTHGRPLLISDTLATSLLGWAKAAHPSQAVHLFLMPLLEQCLAVQENWPNAEKIVAGLYAAEEHATPRATDGPGLTLWITRWLILTACWRRDVTGLAALQHQESRNYGPASFAFNPSEIKVGKMPTAEAETMLRLFCIRLLGMARTANQQITLCLLSLFDDASLRVRRTVAHAIAFRCLNLLHQNRDPLAHRTLRHHHHRRTKRCTGHLHRQFSNPFLYILSCAKDACSDSTTPAARAAAASSVWRSSANERETFRFWAAETAAHIADCDIFNADTVRHVVADTCDRIRTLCMRNSESRQMRETLWEILAGLLLPWAAETEKQAKKPSNSRAPPPPLGNVMQSVLAALLVFRRDSSTVLRMQCLTLCETLGAACGETYHRALRDVVTGVAGQQSDIHDEPRVADLRDNVLSSVRKGGTGRGRSVEQTDGKRAPLPPTASLTTKTAAINHAAKTRFSALVKTRVASKSPEKAHGAGVPATSTSPRKSARSRPISPPAKLAHCGRPPQMPRSLSPPRRRAEREALAREPSASRAHKLEPQSPPVGEVFADASEDELGLINDFYGHLLDSPPGLRANSADAARPAMPTKAAAMPQHQPPHAIDSPKQPAPRAPQPDSKKTITDPPAASNFPPEDYQPDGIMRLSEIQDDSEKDAMHLAFGKDNFLDEWSGAREWGAAEALLVPNQDAGIAATRERNGYQDEMASEHNWVYGIDWRDPPRPVPPPRQVQAAGRDAGSRATTAIGIQSNDTYFEARTAASVRHRSPPPSRHVDMAESNSVMDRRPLRQTSWTVAPWNTTNNPTIPNVSLNTTSMTNSPTRPAPAADNAPIAARRTTPSSNIDGPNPTYEIFSDQPGPLPSFSFPDSLREHSIATPAAAMQAPRPPAVRSNAARGVDRATNTTPVVAATQPTPHGIASHPPNRMFAAAEQANDVTVLSSLNITDVDIPTIQATREASTDMDGLRVDELRTSAASRPPPTRRHGPRDAEWSFDFSAEWENWRPQTGTRVATTGAEQLVASLLAENPTASTPQAVATSKAVQKPPPSPPAAAPEDEDNTPPWSIAIQHPPELSEATTPMATAVAPSTMGAGNHAATAFLRPSLRRAALALLARLFAASLRGPTPPLHPLLKSAFTLDPSLLVALLRRAVAAAPLSNEEVRKHTGEAKPDDGDDEDEGVAAALARLAPCSRIVEELERDIGPLTVAQVLLVLRDQVVVDRICRKGAMGGDAGLVPWAVAEERGFMSSFAAAVAV
ncbi:hypothetical protein HDU88_000676 [Geranomyces variabilis]|nr:hypothetical protein HDU88_000676 [Geranomyces variabilis]